MNNTFFGSVALWFWELFRYSYMYKVCKNVYRSVSQAWTNSLFVRLFLKDATGDRLIEKSLIYKILYLPFWFLSLFALPWGTKLCRIVTNSKAYDVLYGGAQNLYAVNTRFLGVLLIFGGGTYMAALKDLQPVAMGVVIMGILLGLFNINLMGAVRGSIISPLAKSFLDVDFNFDFISKARTTGGVRLILAAILGVLGGFLAGYYSLLYAVAPVGLLLFAFNLPLATALTIFAIPFIPTMIAAGLSGLCMALLVIQKSAAGDRTWRFGTVEFLIVAFMAVYAICSFTSAAMLSSIKIFLLCSVLISFYFLIINSVKSRKQLNTLLLLFVLSAFLVSVYGIIQYVFKLDMDKQVWLDQQMFADISMRAYSTLENPNVLGEYLLLVIPICVAFFWTKPKLMHKIGYGGLLAVLSVCMILTMSRGCWLGLLLAVAIFITFVDGRYWLLAFVGLLILPLILPQSIVSRFSSIGNLQDTSSSYRLFIWLGTLRMLKDYWLVGVGPGTEAFNVVYPSYAYDRIIAPHAHNVYLQLTAETGIVGLMAFVLVCVAFFRKLSAKTTLLAQTHPDRIMIVALCAGVASFLFQGAFDYIFYNYRVYLMFWATLGLGMCFVYTSDKEKKPL